MRAAVAPRAARGGWILILRVLLSVLFVGAGLIKLAGAAPIVALFAMLGTGQWLRYAVGICEVAGALLLVLPPLAGIGALLLCGIMLGAIATQLLVARAVRLVLLRHVVITASPLVPMVVLGLLVLVAWTYRADTADVLARARSAWRSRSRRRQRGYEAS